MNDQWVVRWPLLRAVDSLNGRAARGIRAEAVHCLCRERDGDITFTKELRCLFNSLRLGRVALALVGPPISQRPVPRFSVESVDRDNPRLETRHGEEKSGKSALTIASENTREQQLDVKRAGSMTQLWSTHAIRTWKGGVSAGGRSECRRAQVTADWDVACCLSGRYVPVGAFLRHWVDDHRAQSHPERLIAKQKEENRRFKL